MPALSVALLGRGSSPNDGTGDTARDGALKLNRNARLLEALAKGAVISATTTAQPASPSVGDLYIIPSGKTGTDWSAMTNGSLALYAENDGANAWFEIAPSEGWRVYARDTNIYYYHNGSAWAALISAAMAPVVQGAVLQAAQALGEAEAGHARTSWYGANDAALAAAVATSGADGTVTVDNAVVLTSTYSGGDGMTLRFEGGTIAPPASSATFTWNGRLEAPANRQIFAGANIARVRVSSECEYLRPEWFGALGDATTDDTDALQAAIDALPATGGTIRGRAVYGVTEITIGDGNSTTQSSKHGVRLIGEHAGGVGNGEYGPVYQINGFRYVGAQDNAAVVLSILGPVHSVTLERWQVDCANSAGVGVYGRWLYRSSFIDSYVEAPRVLGWDVGVYDVATKPLGVAQGCMDNIWFRSGTRGYGGVNMCGITMSGVVDENQGFSRNRFEDCVFLRGGHADSWSIKQIGIDNNSFDGVLCIGVSGSLPANGHALLRVVNNGNQAFPHENVWSGRCNLVGSVSTVDMSGDPATQPDGQADLFLGYMTNDGAPIPTASGVRGITRWGGLFGDYWMLHSPTLISAATDLVIRKSTTDGADFGSLAISGGGGFNFNGNRGAGIALYGNENANTGLLLLFGGASGGGVSIRGNGGPIAVAASTINYGVTGASVTYRHVANDQSVIFSGGNAFNAGANLRLSGGAGATANDFALLASTTAIVAYSHAVTTLTFAPAGGSVYGAPTGGAKGAGTINAQGVYDDNVLLTDLVLDFAADGAFDRERYASHPIAREIAAWWLDPEAYAAHWRAERSLPGMRSWGDETSRPSAGEQITRLTAVVETQAVLIDGLHRRLARLERGE